MASGCIPDLPLRRATRQRTIRPREGVTSTRRSRTTQRLRWGTQLDDWRTSGSRSIIGVGAKEKRLGAQVEDWKSFFGSTSTSTGVGVGVKEKRLGAQVEDWKSSGASSDTLNAQLARDDLLGLIAGEERGLRTQRDPRKRDEIIKAIDALAILGAETVTTDESLSAAWRMLWTTEKEQLFIVEKASVFGTEAGDILQVIDVASRTLNNVITFPPTGMFLVNSTIEVESAQRVSFKFTKASLRIGDWTIPFPPFGQGWFESVYLDDKIRVAKDIRGDYLVVDRASSVPDLS